MSIGAYFLDYLLIDDNLVRWQLGKNENSCLWNNLEYFNKYHVSMNCILLFLNDNSLDHTLLKISLRIYKLCS